MLLCLSSIALLWSLNVNQAFGQRVYADAEQHGVEGVLTSVNNPSYAYDPNHSNYSSLNVLVGLLGINTASQNLQYTDSIKPIPSSPVYMKIEANGALTILSLLSSIRIVRTLGGISNEVGSSYNSTQFLNLLGLLPSGTTTYLVTPLDNTANFDGLKLVNGDGVTAVSSTANLYFSFFIATPEISADTDSICQNALADSLTLSLANRGETGITYYLFTDTAGLNYNPAGALNTGNTGFVGSFTNHQITITNPFLTVDTTSGLPKDFTQDYYIIAKDTANSPAFFYSAWKKITFKRTILEAPTGPPSVNIQ